MTKLVDNRAYVSFLPWRIVHGIVHVGGGLLEPPPRVHDSRLGTSGYLTPENIPRNSASCCAVARPDIDPEYLCLFRNEARKSKIYDKTRVHDSRESVGEKL